MDCSWFHFIRCTYPVSHFFLVLEAGATSFRTRSMIVRSADAFGVCSLKPSLRKVQEMPSTFLTCHVAMFSLSEGSACAKHDPRFPVHMWKPSFLLQQTRVHCKPISEQRGSGRIGFLFGNTSSLHTKEVFL